MRKLFIFCFERAKYTIKCTYVFDITVAFRIYDIDNDGLISNGELFQVLKMMVGNNLKETQLQQIVDKTILNADKDGDGKICFSEFCAVSVAIVQILREYISIWLIFLVFYILRK